MALVVYWYDFICFGIVVAAYIGSLWVLWRKEVAHIRSEDTTRMYQSLLHVTHPDREGFVPAATQRQAHIGFNQLWTSCWKGVHPGWLLLTRFVSFVAMAAFLCWDLVDWGATIFVYYTEWTFALVLIYFGVGTLISAYGCLMCSTEPVSSSGFKAKEDVEEPKASVISSVKEVHGKIKLQSYCTREATPQRAGFWGYLMQTVYQTCAGAVVMTDIVFWCLIVPLLSISHLRLTTLMGCMHSVNAILLLLDTALNNIPFPWFRIAYFVQWSCTYIVFQWVLHACGFSWWPYPFLELDTPWAPLWYLCLAVFHIPCYGIFTLIVRVKYEGFPRWFPNAFIRAY